MKLTTLKRGLPVLQPKVAALLARPSATPRLRGRAAVERRDRWLRMHPLCCDCQAETPARVTVALEVDHVVPLWQGGVDDESNFASRCIPHHAAKTAREAKLRAIVDPARV